MIEPMLLWDVRLWFGENNCHIEVVATKVAKAIEIAEAIARRPVNEIATDEKITRVEARLVTE